MRLLSRLMVPLAVLCLLLANGMVALAETNEEPRVESVEVQLQSTSKIYEGLQERIEFSIAKVGEKILLSQPLSILKNNEANVKSAITNVFSKVLLGFRVDAVNLVLEKHTKVVIHLTPIPPLITNIKLNLEVKELAPEVNQFTGEISEKVETELNQVFVGLPVAAFSWSGGIFNLVINYLLEREIPGFSSNFSLEPGNQTVVNLKLKPLQPQVESVIVNYRSTSLPAWLISYKAREYQEKFDILKGMPVEFLIHYQPELEKQISNYLNNRPELGKNGLEVNLRIHPGNKTVVDLQVESEHYQAKLESRYYLGQHDEAYGNIQAYLSYRNDGYEIFSRLSLGENPVGPYILGIGFELERNFYGGFEYEFENQYKDVWLHFQFERGDYFDFRLGLDDTPNEAVIGIYLNNYANLELVDYDSNYGLQLMFHF